MSARRAPATPADLGDAGAEAIRRINHLTKGPDAFAEPGDVYALVGELARLAHALPQALNQAEAWLDHADTHELIHTDTPVIDPLPVVDPVPVTTLARSSLRLSAALAANLAHALDGAHAHLAHLAPARPRELENPK